MHSRQLRPLVHDCMMVTRSSTAALHARLIRANWPLAMSLSDVSSATYTERLVTTRSMLSAPCVGWYTVPTFT